MLPVYLINCKVCVIKVPINPTQSESDSWQVCLAYQSFILLKKFLTIKILLFQIDSKYTYKRDEIVSVRVPMFYKSWSLLRNVTSN